MFSIAAETGWTEERILFMPLSRLAQYQHCLLRRNGVRTGWSLDYGEGQSSQAKFEWLQRAWAKSRMVASPNSTD